MGYLNNFKEPPQRMQRTKGEKGNYGREAWQNSYKIINVNIINNWINKIRWDAAKRYRMTQDAVRRNGITSKILLKAHNNLIVRKPQTNQTERPSTTHQQTGYFQGHENQGKTKELLQAGGD